MLSYNGGWSLTPRQQKTVEAYHKFLQERDLSISKTTAGASSNLSDTGALPATVAPTSPAMPQSDMNRQVSFGTVEPVISPTSMSWESQSATLPQQAMVPQAQSASSGSFAPAGMQGSIATTMTNSVSTPIRRSSRPIDIFGVLPSTPNRDKVSESGVMNVTRVTYADEGGDFDPAISPDARHMAFASTRHTKTADIYIKSITGTTITQITNDPAHDVTPVFSPDGTQLAFASNRTGNWDIYIVKVTGGQPVQITHDPTQDLSPSFSPDGRWLVYASYGSQSGRWELVVINLANPSVKQLIGFGLFPKWSPTGNRILFQRARQRGTQWFSIWTVDLVNGEATRPTEIIASANAAVITPSWSPDGKHIVFATTTQMHQNPSVSRGLPPVSDIWMASIDGTGRTNLTRSRFSNLQPCWGPDGRIYFVSNRGKGAVENIWSVRPDLALQTVKTMAQMSKPSPSRLSLQNTPGNTPESIPGHLSGARNGMAAVTTIPAVDQQLFDKLFDSKK